MFVRKLEDDPIKVQELKKLNFLNKKNNFNKKLKLSNLDPKQQQFIENLQKRYPILKNYKLSEIILFYRKKDFNLNDLICRANELGISCDKPRRIIKGDLANFCEEHVKDKKLVKQLKVKTEKENLLKKYGVDNVSKLDHVKEKRKKTLKNKYGVENPSQSKEIQEKIKQTCLKKYGVESVLKAPEIREKIKKKVKEKYGVENVSKSDLIKERKKETSKVNYGTENPMQADEVKKKYQRTILEKYGVNNIFQNKEIQEKIKKTRLEKYGVEYPFQSKEIQEKIIQTFKNKYGVIRPFQSEEIQEKAKLSCIKKYNVERPLQSKEIQEKANNTCIEKYGSESPLSNKEIYKKARETFNKKFNCFYPMQNKEIKEKAQLTCLNKYGVKVPSQKHLKNLDKLNKEFIEENFFNENSEFLYHEFKEFYGYAHSRPHQILKELNINYKKRGGTSSYEDEIVEFIKSFYSGEIIKNDRSIIAPKELDIYIPEHNLAIEFHGLFWHSINNKNQIKYYKFKHLEKTKACEAKGINLLHIFENEWLDPIKKDIWKSIIKYKLKSVNKKYFARKLDLKLIQDKKLVRKFFDENHLQGGGAIGSILIGGFDKKTGELITCMTFGKSRYNKEIGYELIRFASKKYSACIGCASKLFKYFVSNFDPKSIVSYANRRWASAGANLYSTIGLKYVGESEPNYFYFKPNEVIPRLYPRVTFQKHKLKDHPDTKDFYSSLLTESEIMFAAGFRRIYDAGNLIFHWKKEKEK